MAARFDACRQRQVDALEGAPPSAALAAVSLLDSLRDEVRAPSSRPPALGRGGAGLLTALTPAPRLQHARSYLGTNLHLVYT